MLSLLPEASSRKSRCVHTPGQCKWTAQRGRATQQRHKPTTYRRRACSPAACGDSTCAQASPRPARTLSIEKCETARCTGCSCEVGGGGKESEQENTLQSIRRTGARLHMRDGVSCLCTHSGHRMTRKAVDGKGGRRKRGTSRRMIRKRSDAGSGITTCAQRTPG
eukprot:scaffold15379_cov133-Isochrysis_galbana.AAC.9